MNSDTQKFQSLINKEKYQVFILACPTYTPFNFARHSWFVLNKKGLISRWEIRHKKNKKTNNYFYLNTQPPFQGINISFFIKKHFWKAKLMGYIEGSENSTAQKIIEFIENSEKIYREGTFNRRGQADFCGYRQKASFLFCFLGSAGSRQNDSG